MMGSFLAWAKDYPALVTGTATLVATVLTLGGGLLVGQAITAKWNMRVKEREWDLEAIQQVRDLYGEFLSTRRLWNYHLQHHRLSTLDTRGLELFDRSCVAEGKLEALLIKVTTERFLSPNELDELGLFRQGYQQLRECIRDIRPLTWGSSDHPEYLALKRGCRTTIRILSNSKTSSIEDQFDYVTANIHEKRWRRLSRS